MKRILTAILVSVVMILGVAAVFPATAKAEETSGDYTYTLDDSGNATIIGYSVSGPVDVAIPSTLDDHPVTAIAEYAFQGNTSITSVSMPDSVKTLEDSAFEGCSQLVSVTLSAGLAEIPQHAFQGAALTDVTIPEGVTAIDFNAFNSCLALLTVSLPSTLTTVGPDAFCGCVALTTVTLPANNHLLSIQHEGFGDCDKLASFDFRDGLQSIGSDAFYSDAFQEITLPASLQSIGDGAFYPGVSLHKVYILTSGTGELIFGKDVFDATALNGDASYGIYGYANSDANTYATGNSINFHSGYLVTFDPGTGASVTTQSATVYNGEPYGTLPTPERTGWDFLGWYTGTDGSGTQITENDTVDLSSDIMLYADWSIHTYSINYVLNSGTVTISNSTTYTVNDSFTLNNPTRPGYIFAGWSGPDIAGESTAVTIASGSTGDRTYTANWTNNQPKTSYLSGIAYSAGKLTPNFSKARYSYTLSLGENVASVTITPTAQNDGATMTINGSAVASIPVTLANGKSQTVKIKVSFPKQPTRTYTIKVSRAKSTDDNLLTLSATAGTLSPALSVSNTKYTLTLDENTKTTTITDTVEATGLAKASFTSKTVSLLNNQTKVVYLTVRAQSGKSKTYKITVYRKKSSDAYLTYINAGSTLVYGFDKDTLTGYTATIAPNSNSIVISVKAEGYKAKVTMDGKTRTSEKVTISGSGSKTVYITVTAQDGTTINQYEVTVYKP